MTRASRFTRTLLARLLAGYVAVALVLAAAWTWSLFGPLTNAAVRQQVSHLTAVAQSAALLTAVSDTTPAEVARRLVARTDLRVTIVAADGTVIADSDFEPAKMENHAARPEVRAALAGDVGTDRRHSSAEGVEALYVAVPGSLDGERVAIRVSEPMTEIEVIAARSRRFGLALLGLALGIAGLVALWAARSTARPVRELSQAAERMAGGDLHTPIPETPSDLTGLANALGMLRDEVTSRIGALHAERSTLSATLDGLEEAVLLVESGRVRFANRHYHRMFGVTPERLVDTPLADAGMPAALLEAITSHTQESSPSATELDPDPLGRTYRIAVTSLMGPGNVQRDVVVISDVTERARVDRVRRDFVANASHELKTPVSGIRLLADNAAAAASDGDTETALEFTRRIATEAQRLQHLVSDLLDLSRLELTPSPSALTNVRTAVDRAVTSHRPHANAKGLALDVDLGAVAGSDVFVASDATDVAIALDNLVDNAVAYTPEGGVTIHVKATDDTVSIAVIDTGPGIAVEHRERVFERFYRVDTGRSREAGGTGLGLALVRHVVDRIGGRVTLESEPGVGSTFTLWLPRAR